MLTGPLLEHLKPMVVGRNPLDIGVLWAEMWRAKRLFARRTFGSVDVALRDLAGRVAGLPIHCFFGFCRERVPAYSGSARLPSPGAYAEGLRPRPGRPGLGYEIDWGALDTKHGAVGLLSEGLTP